jgi:site-specific DNA recombinase
MTPTHANKKGTRYRHYVSQSLIQRDRPKNVDIGRRVPAGELEHLVEQRIIDFLGDGAAIFGVLEPLVPDPIQRGAMVETAARFARAWPELNPADRTSTLHRLVDRIDFRRDRVEIRIRAKAAADFLDATPVTSSPSVDCNDAATTPLSVPINLRRAGKQNRLLIERPGDPEGSPDRSLLRLLGQAHRFGEMVLGGDGRSIGALASEAGVVQSYFTRILRLNFLSPRIVKLILEGRHPPRLTAKSLIGQSPKLARDWMEQSKQLGFA